MQLLFAFMLFSEDMPIAFDISSSLEASQSSDYNGQIDFSCWLFYHQLRNADFVAARQQSMPLFSPTGSSCLFKQLEPMNTSIIQKSTRFKRILRAQYLVGKLGAEVFLFLSHNLLENVFLFCNFDQSYNKSALFRVSSDVIIGFFFKTEMKCPGLLGRCLGKLISVPCQLEHLCHGYETYNSV